MRLHNGQNIPQKDGVQYSAIQATGQRLRETCTLIKVTIYLSCLERDGNLLPGMLLIWPAPPRSNFASKSY